MIAIGMTPGDFARAMGNSLPAFLTRQLEARQRVSDNKRASCEFAMTQQTRARHRAPTVNADAGELRSFPPGAAASAASRAEKLNRDRAQATRSSRNERLSPQIEAIQFTRNPRLQQEAGLAERRRLAAESHDIKATLHAMGGKYRVWTSPRRRSCLPAARSNSQMEFAFLTRMPR